MLKLYLKVFEKLGYTYKDNDSYYPSRLYDNGYIFQPHFRYIIRCSNGSYVEFTINIDRKDFLGYISFKGADGRQAFFYSPIDFKSVFKDTIRESKLELLNE